MGRPKGSVNKAGGGKRKMKDPNHPKRPTSAYFFYAARMRQEAAAKGQPVTQVAPWTKEISGLWRSLTASERSPFEQMAAKDKARYDAEMKIYKGKDENKPKKPMSSYFMFLGQFREKNRDRLGHKELLSAAGEAWRSMTDVDKQPYEQMASLEKNKYDLAMKEYHAQKAGGSVPKQQPSMEVTADKNGEGADEDDEEEYTDEEEDDE